MPFRGTHARHGPVPETLVAPAPCHGRGDAERTAAYAERWRSRPCARCRAATAMSSSSAPAPARSPRRCWPPASRRERLALVERDPELAAFLRRHFRGPRIIEGDAARLPRFSPTRASRRSRRRVGPAAAVAAGRGRDRHRARRVRGAAARGAALVQFTYGPSPPMPRALRESLHLVGAHGRRIWRNVPPAVVWTFRRPHAA